MEKNSKDSKRKEFKARSQTICPFNVLMPKKLKITNINKPKNDSNIINKEESNRNKNNFFHSIIVTKNINKNGGILPGLYNKNILHKDKYGLEPKKNISFHKINATKKEPTKDVVAQPLINKSIIATRIYHLTETNNKINNNHNQFSYTRKIKTSYKPLVSLEQKKTNIKNLRNNYQITKTQISSRNIKSPLIIKKIFSFLYEKTKLDIIKYNKYFQKLFLLKVGHYRKISGKYKIEGINGEGKEFILNTKILIFEGEYKNGKKNGIGKEYDNGNIVFEGEYKNGKKNGKGIEYHYYYGQLEYNSKPYFRSEDDFCDRYNTIGFFKVELKKAFEGEYKDGKRNGKGKEYWNNKLKFEGEYLDGKRWDGKIEEYNYNNALKFRGQYINGKKIGKKIGNITYNKNKIYKGEILNGKANGKGKEYWKEELRFEGEYLNGKRNGKGKEYWNGIMN